MSALLKHNALLRHALLVALALVVYGVLSVLGIDATPVLTVLAGYGGGVVVQKASGGRAP